MTKEEKYSLIMREAINYNEYARLKYFYIKSHIGQYIAKEDKGALLYVEKRIKDSPEMQYAFAQWYESYLTLQMLGIIPMHFRETHDYYRLIKLYLEGIEE